MKRDENGRIEVKRNKEEISSKKLCEDGRREMALDSHNAPMKKS